MSKFVALAFLGAVRQASTTNTTNDISDVELKVQGQSGKFSLFSTSKGENDPNKITVTMDSLYEVNEAGDIIGNTGSVKHSIQTFASQSFTIQQPSVVSINGSDVNASKTTFSSTIGTVGELIVDTLIVLGKGVVGPESDQWEVSPGDLKWNIGFSSWNFCGSSGFTCRNQGADQEGKYLDLDIEVKGSASSASTANGGKTFSLGGGVNIQLTNKVTVDGNETTLPEGYPKVETQGGKQVFKFRFPKFTSSLSYDPVIETSNLVDSPSSMSIPSSRAGLTVLAAAMATAARIAES